MLRVPTPLVVAFALVTGLASCTSPTSSAALEESTQCIRQHSKPTPDTRSKDILEGLIDPGPFGPVQLGTDLNWDEDPYQDANWRNRLHSMRWLKTLSKAYRATGDPVYLEAWRSYWQDWAADNPVTAPASEEAWGHHPTGLRAKLLACALTEMPPSEHSWIKPLLRTHGEMLKREDFYVGQGNHALNQAQGLLAAGCVLDEQDWIDLGMERIDALVPDSITADGATNEGSISYAAYNFDRYSEALERIQLCKQPEPPLLHERLPKLATFIAHAILPNGEIPLIGDSNAKRVPPWFSPEVAYARSLGAEGSAPEKLSAVYPIGGWAFGRNTWDRRHMADSVVYALRTGHASNIHSHDDLGHLSIFGYGRRLIEDSGLYAYANPLNQYFYAARAHNGVVVKPGTYKRYLGSQLASSRSTAAYDLYVLDLTAWDNVRWLRRVLYSREGGWFLIDDQLVAGRRPRTFTVNWHLSPGSRPLLEGRTMRTRFPKGNTSVTMLTEDQDLQIVTGRKKPMQGFVALKFGKISETSVLEAVTPEQSRKARFVTLITTSEASKRPRIKGLDLSDGVSASITVGRRTDKVRWTGTTVALDCVKGC